MQTFLYIGASFRDQWHQVILPWFETMAKRNFDDFVRLRAVVTPSRSHADFLRRKLLRRRISLLGVIFLTPAQLRELLLADRGSKLPLREDLRLLLATAAEEIAATTASGSESLVADSIARDPDNFLRAIDQLDAAGFSSFEIEPVILRQIRDRFKERVRECGFDLVCDADRSLLQNPENSLPRFSDLLVSGFDGAHWPLWPLLRATVLRSECATIILNDPRDETRDLDEAWVGSWEEHFGAAIAVASVNDTAQFAELANPLESAAAVASRKHKPLPNVHFLIGRDTSEQARAIAAIAVAFLNQPDCDQIAILLPGPGALARLVAQALETLGIHHNDSVAHPMRGPFDDEQWRAWLELQRRPQLTSLLRFLRHSPGSVRAFGSLRLREIENKLRHACGDILISDVDVLAEYCSRKHDEKLTGIASGLRSITLLPGQGTLTEFLKKTVLIFRQLDWGERVNELERLSTGWSGQFRATFAREHFLNWLTQVFSESALCRDPKGDHPYARVQLLRYDQAENQSWSHLILAGLNEGAWPKRDDESPFFSDEHISALNAEISSMNKRATRQGRFGAGQTVVHEGKTLCLGARERRGLARRQLFNAIESTRCEIAVVAQLYASTPREHAVNPSEFFAQLYFNARGMPLSQTEIERVHLQTRKWLVQGELFAPGRPANPDIAQTITAYRERRRSDTKFGEYEFAFREGSPPLRKVSLSATDAARLFTSPALVWMKMFLGIEGEEEFEGASWNLTTGQWVHRWLARIAQEPSKNRLVPFPRPPEIIDSVTSAAENFRSEVSSILSAGGRPLPDWWLSGWRNAYHVAEEFARKLTALADWPRLATEWMLDSPQTIHLRNGGELRVRGRIDLLLARGDQAQPGELWIVDYKTGVASALKRQMTSLRKQLMTGNGIQVCVYALALQEVYRTEIGVSVLPRGSELAPQLNISDILAQNEVWEEIARMENSGIFGMLGELRSKFTFTGDYPLATLAIDQDILSEKWGRTHPMFVPKETE